MVFDRICSLCAFFSVKKTITILSYRKLRKAIGGLIKKIHLYTKDYYFHTVWLSMKIFDIVSHLTPNSNIYDTYKNIF